MDVTSDASPGGLHGKLVTRLRLRLARPYLRWSRGMTLGARVLVIDGEGKFLLVRHTYQPGWILPGGGVERGETCLAAALREVREEAAIIPTGVMALHGVFSNHKDFPGDHLVVYVLREFERGAFKPSLEIADARFFAWEELPASTTAGSLRRMEEVISSLPPSTEW
jgi:8-oxo-dGTP pyrophosphatase MutT (NUDIX family)